MDLKEAIILVKEDGEFCRASANSCCNMDRKDDYATWLNNKAEAIELVLEEINRLRNVVKDCRKQIRELDINLEFGPDWKRPPQSYPDYCKDTLRLTGEL